MHTAYQGVEIEGGDRRAVEHGRHPADDGKLKPVALQRREDRLKAG